MLDSKLLKKQNVKMSADHRLQEVKAFSACGIEIIVEQIYQKYKDDLTSNESWIALPKIVIIDKVIDLDCNNSFTHPRTETLFKILALGDLS